MASARLETTSHKFMYQQLSLTPNLDTRWLVYCLRLIQLHTRKHRPLRFSPHLDMGRHVVHALIQVAVVPAFRHDAVQGVLGRGRCPGV